MAGVNFPVALGGDGSTITDDGNVDTGLANGGHRVRFIKALQQLVAICSYTVSRALSGGRLAKSVAGGVDVALTADECKYQFFEFTGILTANINVVVDNTVRAIFVRNATTGAFTLTVKTAAGTGVAVPQGERVMLECDGTNVLEPLTHASGLHVGDGTVGAPAVAFASDTDNGLYKKAPNVLGVSKALDVALNATINGKLTVSAAEAAFGYGEDLAIGAKNNPKLLWSQSGGYNWSAYVDQAVNCDWHLRHESVGADFLTVTRSGNLLLGGTSVAALDGVFGAVIGSPAKGNAGVAVECATRAYMLYTDPSGALMVYDATNNVERSRFDAGGNFLVNFTGAASAKCVVKSAGNGTYITQFLDSGENAHTAFFQGASGVSSGWSGASTAIYLAKDVGTSRSMNAAGTLNGSGADAAEYERRSATCPQIAKGGIVGFNADGELTLRYAAALRFGFKTTNPHLVGGDTWGTEEAIGMARPVEPPKTPPELPAAPELPVQPVVENPEELTDDERAALTAWHDACAALVEAYEAECERIVEEAEQVHRLAMIDYAADLVRFEQKIEAARQWVDRIVYSGKAPIAVYGANPGDYILAAEADDGTITGRIVTKAEMKADPSLLLEAVGRVNRIIDAAHSARLAKAANMDDPAHFVGMAEAVAIVL